MTPADPLTPTSCSFEPFRKIALASALSPRFLPLLSEARGIAERFGAALDVIHASSTDFAKEDLFRRAFRNLRFESEPALHVATGEPVAEITRAIEKLGVDLLILGALEREQSGRSFVGDVARRLMRDAPCSLLVLTKPLMEQTRFERIAAMTDFSPAAARALQAAVYLGERDRSRMIHVASILTVFDQARAVAAGNGHAPSREEDRLAGFVESTVTTDLDMDVTCLEGTTGFAACEFLERINADLLVLPSQGYGTRSFPHGMDWVQQTIPTNLLMVRAPR